MKLLKRKPRKNWNDWKIPNECIQEIRREFRDSRKKYGFAFFTLVLVVSYGFWDASESRKLACIRENETRGALTSVVNRWINDRKALNKSGSISSHQYEHELEVFIFARNELQPRNCKRELFAVTAKAQK